MMYTLKILECNEFSTSHQMTKMTIDDLGSRYFLYTVSSCVASNILYWHLTEGVHFFVSMLSCIFHLS